MSDQLFLVSLLWTAISVIERNNKYKNHENNHDEEENSVDKQDFVMKFIESTKKIYTNFVLNDFDSFFTSELIDKYDAIHSEYKNCFNDLSNSSITLSTGKYNREFILKGKLGKGSSGKVYKVESKSDKQSYAIKKIAVEGNIKRTSNEIVIWAKLKNSYIVNYNHSWFENHPLRRESILLYIQMEICETTLKDLIKKIDIEMGQNERGGTRPVGLYISCQLFLQIVKGVNYLHMQEPPIIHRDLKPSNILVIKHSKSKLLKISDFGLTTHHESHYIDQKLTSGSHTTGVGSLKYMAPEVKRSKRYSEKSDLYSLGIIFKDLLCINENLMEKKLQTDQIKQMGLIHQLISEFPEKRPKCDEILRKKRNWMLSFEEMKHEKQMTDVIWNFLSNNNMPETYTILKRNVDYELEKTDMNKKEANEELDAIKKLSNFNDWRKRTNIKDKEIIKKFNKIILHSIHISCCFKSFKDFIKISFPDWSPYIEMFPHKNYEELISLMHSMDYDYFFICNENAPELIVFIIKSNYDWMLNFSSQLQNFQPFINVFKKEKPPLETIKDIIVKIQDKDIIFNLFHKIKSLDSKFLQEIKFFHAFGDRSNEILLSNRSNEFYAIGENKYGLLCTGNEKKCHSPTLLSNECFQNIIYIATGIKHVIALNKFGEVYAWGYNDSGQLGKFYCRKPNYKPFILNKFKRQKIFKISCGFYHSVALTNSGELFAWGQNSKLQCGSAYNYNYFEPMRLKKPETVSFVSISCGSHHTIALDKRGNVYAWGSNYNGQLGCGSSKKYHLLRRVEFRNIIIKKIKCGKDHSLVLSTEGDIYAFGKNKYGQIGNGSNIDKIKPVKINNVEKFDDIAASLYFDASVALSKDGFCYIWGKFKDHIFKTPTKTQLKSMHNVFAFLSITYEPISTIESKF